MYRTPLVLCHPDGSFFCDYLGASGVFRLYVTDTLGDPPDPGAIVQDGGMSRVDHLRWRPLVACAVLGEAGDILAPYEDNLGGDDIESIETITDQLIQDLLDAEGV